MKIIRNQSDLEAEKQGCYWDQQAGDRLIRFIEQFLIGSKGPVRLMRWQDELLRTIWSWRRPDNSFRFHFVYLQCPRQQGKSFVIFCLLMGHMLLDIEKQPYVIATACNMEQGKTIFDYAADSINANDKLRRIATVVPSRNYITISKKHARYKILSSLPKNSRSKPASLVIFDEIAHYKNREIYDSMKPSINSKTNGMIFCATTPGLEKTHFAHSELYQLGKRINDGSEINISTAAFIYEADPNCEIDDETQWSKSLPSLHELTRIETVREACALAKNSTMGTISFRAEYLAQWAQKASTFLNLDTWKSNKGTFPELDHLPAFYGCDLSASGTDLTAVVKAVPCDGKVYITCQAFCHEEAIRRRAKANLISYKTFEGDGNMTFVPGNTQDYGLLRDWITNQPNPCSAITFDMNFANETCQILMGQGFNVKSLNQGFGGMNGPTKYLEQLVNEHRLIHKGEAIWLWSAGNMIVERNSFQEIRPNKARTIDKVDVMVSCILALSMIPEAVNNNNDSMDYWNKVGAVWL